MIIIVFTNDIFIVTFYRSIFNSFFRLFAMIVQNLTAFFSINRPSSNFLFH